MEFLQPGNDAEKAFKAAFLEYLPKLVTFVKKMVDDEHTAQTIVHDAFLDLKKKGHDFENKNILPKLYKTITHDYIDYFRRQTTQNKKEKEFGQWLLAQNAISRDPFSAPEVVEAELFQKLRNALEELSPRESQVTREWMTDGQKAKDIARKLGIRENTVSTTKKNSLTKLGRIMRRGDAIIWLIIKLILSDNWKN